MAPGVFCVSLLTVIIAQSVECCVPHSIQAQVPVEVRPGYVISQVPVTGCHIQGQWLTSSDPHFAMRSDGTIVTVDVTTVTAEGRSFWVRGRDGGGRRWRMEVHLSPDLEQEHIQVPMRVPFNVPAHKGVPRGPSEVLRRSKRRWSPLPFSIIEQDIPPFPKDVELVGSDSSVNFTVYYIISGSGVTMPPENLFSVDRDRGMVRVHYPVDREQYPKFVFTAQVFDRRSGKETDRPLDITVLVEDINDNAPTFSGPLTFSVLEQCKPGTEVGEVRSTDKDEADTPHTKIRYTLLTGGQFFTIGSHSGLITAKTSTLDRETQVVNAVTVEIRDMDGAKNGLFNTATATITLLDINDNPPTFRETIYKASVKENQADVLVLRIPVDDKDEEKTPNWNARFVITQGNENGNFRIDTDPETNEGLLYVIKPLDYEKGKTVKLMISAQNEAPLVGIAGTWLSIPVDVSVGDEDEGPEFTPPNMVIRVKENTPNGTLLSTYTALDPETKSSKGIKYYTKFDPGSWIAVGETTGELRVANTIDLESPLVTNGAYTITIKAVDESKKSGNGNITLLIEDVNDNVPMIVPGTYLTLCEGEDGQMGSVTIEAEDADLSPYARPFNFMLPEGHDGKWRLRDIQNGSAVLEQVVEMARGVYTVPVHLTDLQNKGGVQVLSVRVCQCLGGECVAKRSSVSVGIWGVLAMLLAFLLLLLLCLLFVFYCTTKGEKIYMEDCSGGMLLKSNTEAPGDEVKSAALLIVPSTGVAVDTVDGSVKGAGLVGLLDQNGAGCPAPGPPLIGQKTINLNRESSRRDFLTAQGQSSFYSTGQYGGGNFYTDTTFLKQSQASSTLSALHTWKTNGLYLGKKLVYFADESEERFADDLARAYGYEGEGSPAGSVGCCSDFGDQDNLDFLDSLGSKFKTLANICMDKEEEI
ncbi:desmocollin 2-like protein [Salvelinus sp. IW2-2015]|uniref:desmocollin 2-like protein n=1 Tax=Salvelinus sp. IW2-2015 TaxID=2691554 RepID=UPI000CDF7C68|nr:desmocollin-2 [Salvelinus alpinus]